MKESKEELSPLDQVRNELKDKLIKEAEFEVNYHTKKLAESKLKLEAAKSLQ